MRLGIGVATMRERRHEVPANSIIEMDTIYDASNAPGDIPLAASNAITEPLIHVRYNTTLDNRGVIGSYDSIFRYTAEDVLCFMHDDVIVREKGWDQRVLKEFNDPQVGLVGFGGAKWHGTPMLYKVPYQLHNLIRGDYVSNVDDAEVHGSRFTWSCDVAVLDGFVLCVRRDVLSRMGGLASLVGHCDYFCYDYAMAALVRRMGMRIRCVGIRCHHRGGQTSVGQENPITSKDAYDKSHRWFYDNFRDVMPARAI